MKNLKKLVNAVQEYCKKDSYLYNVAGKLFTCYIWDSSWPTEGKDLRKYNCWSINSKIIGRLTLFKEL